MARDRGSVFDQHLGSAYDQGESLMGDNIKGPHIKDHRQVGLRAREVVESVCRQGGVRWGRGEMRQHEC